MNNEIPRLSRLTSILVIFQSKKVVTIDELVKRFDISKRTVYRDVKALQEAGIPIFKNEEKGYSLMEGYNLPPVMFSSEEANTLITIEKMIHLNSDQSLIQHYENIVTKIKTILRYSEKEKIELLSERISITNKKKNQPKSNSLAIIQTAIINQTTLEIHYQSLYKEEFTIRTIEPLGLYFTNDNWILIAWCNLRNHYREFRLDRIYQTKALNQPSIHKDFNLKDYFFQVAQKQG